MDEHRYTMSHKEVQRMVRTFLISRGHKVVTKKYNRKQMKSVRSFSGSDRSRYDDVFTAPNGDDIVCEYKPTPIARTTVMTGIGEALTYSAESGLRCYLVICENDYIKFHKAIDKLSPLGLFIYEEGEVKYWRRPVDIEVLPKPNTLMDISLI